jgi:hypothetical protein
MPPMGFEPKISAGERPQTYALDRAATGTGKIFIWFLIIFANFVFPWFSTPLLLQHPPPQKNSTAPQPLFIGCKT